MTDKRTPQVYVIRTLDPRYDNDPMYWNNERGWTDWIDATVFTPDERDRFTLPSDGVWEQIATNEYPDK